MFARESDPAVGVSALENEIDQMAGKLYRLMRGKLNILGIVQETSAENKVTG